MTKVLDLTNDLLQWRSFICVAVKWLASGSDDDGDDLALLVPV